VPSTSSRPSITAARACRSQLNSSYTYWIGTDYWDPPNYGDCPDGAATGCFNLAVLQYWRRDTLRDWERNANLEIVLPEMKNYDDRYK
jgi:hypothetical protein